MDSNARTYKGVKALGGSRVRIWKYGTSGDQPGIETMYVPFPIKDGPCDDEIVVELDGVQVKGSGERDFLFDPVHQQPEFDATHTFAVVRHVVTTYRRILRKLGQELRFEPLRVYPYSTVGRPSLYVPETRTLHFSVQTSAIGPSLSKAMSSCRYFDIVAHQAGHAILDGLNPDLENFSDNSDDSIALRESFADLSVLFSRLARMDECERILVETKGELLFRKSLCSAGYPADEPQMSSRPELFALDSSLWSTQTLRPHERGILLTGAVYQSLYGIWHQEIEVDPLYPAETLFRVAHDLSQVVVQAFLSFNERPATLSGLAGLIQQLEQNPVRRAIILEQRELWNLL